MNEEVYLTPEERLQEISDNLISGIIHRDEKSLERRRYLYGQLPCKVFRDENYVLYKVLYTFKDKGITPDEEFLKMYLLRNVKMLKESSDYIDLSAYADQDESKFVGYITAVINQYLRLSGMNFTQSMDEFKLAIEKYKVEYSGIEMNKAYSQARLMLYDEVQIGRRLYQGYEDSMAYIKSVSACIDSILNDNVGEGFIDSRTEGVVDNNKHKPELISDFDLIDELNEALGGIYTSLLYNIIAPTKGGKSKFTARLVHTAMVKYGVNCSVWAFEGGHEAWWAQLRAIHFEYLYIRNANTASDRVAPLSQDDILLGKYPSEAIRSLEEASRLDLFTNPNYGVVNIISRPFMVETFIDDIDTSVKINNSRLVLIDYLQLIESEMKGAKNNEVVKLAYKKALKYVSDANVALVTPAQFTQEFIKQMAVSKGGTPETRTSGGESSEVIRASDINIALYASLDDLQRNLMQVMSMPSRLSKVFPSFEIYADLCSCVFSSIKED